uniref:Transmembrane 9 superfamily member n=1 Tax=Bicosoecida sp. CB-2014 TaxID=1486930 RepID=A0A7S1G5G4_9STRA|mmetsp:Transcript_12782/g.44762  ORF Transcript_12782/g.44762 Transcript_12782/m.44762 type:complete len:599 (+) Transcript_12782:190-1986(+)
MARVRGAQAAAVALVAMAMVVCAAAADEDPAEHQYKLYDKVPVVANKVGPFANPHETYPYYSLPFCAPDNLASEKHELGELLSGDRKVNSKIDLRFRVRDTWREVCDIVLERENVAKFQAAVEQDYYFEIFIDDLPVWGFVGEHDGDDLLGTAPVNKYLYTHLHFTIMYNGDHVIAANVTSRPEDRVDISSGARTRVRFSYSSEWLQTTLPFEDRLERNSKARFLPESLEIHWLSIINSLVLVVLLTAFLVIILVKVVRNDFTRYMTADEEDLGSSEGESGWKLIHGDVFRFPASPNVFCALVGTGVQLFVMTVSLITMAILGLFAPTRRGAIVTACIVLYALSAGVGGFFSARLFRQLGGKSWVGNIILCSFTFPLPMLLTFAIVNTTAITYESTSALPAGTIIVVLLLFLLVTFPLTVLGGIAGRNTAGDFEAPCRTAKAARVVEPVPFYRGAAASMLLSGFLPFSAISIELHYIFSSVWGHKAYTLFGILFLAFALLTVVTSFIVVALTYNQLAAEDWRWWWRSFHSGGSVGLFIYAYCFFYYYSYSDMSGVLQTTFYFGYMAVVAFGFWLMMGAVGFYSSLFFVRYIYARVKTD